MSRFALLLLVTISFIFPHNFLQAAEKIPSDWIGKIRPDHPRLFINSDTLPAVRQRITAVEQDYYNSIKRLVKAIPVEVDHEACRSGSNNDYGRFAQCCAFVWLIDGDKEALAKAKIYLKAAVEFYNECSSQRKAVQWYSAGRVCAITAYDWIFNELSEADRSSIARAFIKHNKDCNSGPRFVRQNRSDHKTGFYGPTNMPWYMGLAFYNDGIADKEARQLLIKGFQDHIKLLEYRKKSAGTNGGIGSIALGYGLGMYPFTEFNFMHTFQSATGHNLAENYSHMSLLANWVLWNCLPDKQKFGLGDSSPGGNFSDSFLEMHMLNLAHFYAEKFPRRARLAMYIREKLLSSQQHDNYWWPIAPFYVTNCETLPEPQGPDESWPHAMNFDSMGVIHMRSDWSNSATCAVYLSGGEVNNHKHYDQGHFAIYSGEHLTGNSGYYGNRRRNDHLCEYFYRTVAANSILIRADEDHDSPAVVWGGEAKTLDGGQCSHDARQLAFYTDDNYTYAATDISNSYDRRKCRFASRQFAFIYPDTFVIFDRIVTNKPEFEKVFLLHSIDKPEISQVKNSIIVHGDRKKLHTQFLLPEKLSIKTVGGEGKEFYSAGTNRSQIGNAPELAGKWRAEITAETGKVKNEFLTVMQVCNNDSAPAKTELDENNTISITKLDKVFKLRFNSSNSVSMEIEITDAKTGETIYSYKHD